ncbi:HAD family hydrolase [Pelosinus sp. sgz500959]|uniref:HAD family hydrolase n=1 Tax=Pelosinus sp. sgz500959 TaxID=3242472 RepID=UPI00366E6571
MYDVILFDLDGTLTDPKPGITKSVQYALEKMGIVENDLEKLTIFIGPPLIASFKEYYHMNDDEAKQALVYYRERFSQVGLYENAVYEGIKELLEKLQSQGKTLFVATSKPTIFSIKILEHFGLIHFFKAVIGSELDGTRVEKSDVIQFVLSQVDQSAAQKIIMVGDRKFDIVGAQENGIDVVGVSYGYGSCDELILAKPNHIVNTVPELEQLLCI